MELTEQNYYSLESRNAYLSNSDLKVLQECEYRFVKALRGEYEREKTDALLQGSLLDIMLTGTEKEVEEFKNNNPQIYSSRGATKGELKSGFRIVEQMVNKVKNDPKALAYLDGEKQKIFTGNLFGVDMKCKLDVYISHKAIVDLKSCESIRKTYWSDEFQRRVSFVEYFKYIQQMAIYQELVFQNTGEMLPCYLLAVSKEPITDLELIYIDDQTLHDTIYGNEFSVGLVEDITRARMLKNGEVDPIKCGHCDLCLEEKKIEKPIHFTELLS